MVEAYKKYILVGLILTGKTPPMPKYASTPVQRQIRLYASEYIDFATAFSNKANDKVLQLANQSSDLFQRERNLGLVKQCLDALKRINIQRLTQTYLTLSLQDIATSAGLENAKVAEESVLKLVSFFLPIASLLRHLIFK